MSVTKVSKSWIYTINNYTEDDIKFLNQLECVKHRCSKEIGESGTPHLQGFISFNKAYRLAGLKKLHGKAHWEPCISHEHAINYVNKVDSELIIDKQGNQGKRTDLIEAIDCLKKKGLTDTACEHPETYVRFHKGLAALEYRLNLKQSKGKDYPTEVYVLIGKPGSGKSKTVRELCPNVYNVPEPINGTVWFDGYNGEEGILLDDFYGWIRYHTLLQ